MSLLHDLIPQAAHVAAALALAIFIAFQAFKRVQTGETLANS